MHPQLKLVLQRLKTPSVVISLASQIVSILILFHVNLDRGVVVTAVAGICSMLVLLGIMSNPDTVQKGYRDDIHLCANCQQETAHVQVGGQLVCSHCGSIQQPQSTVLPQSGHDPI